MRVTTWRRRLGAPVAVTLLAAGLVAVFATAPAGATTVNDEASFRAAWALAGTTTIDLSADITLTCGGGSTPSRNSATALTLDGHGHTIANVCMVGDQGVLRSTGTGALTVQNVTITGGHAVSNNGSGIETTNAALTLNNVVCTANTGGPGGSAGGCATGDGGPLTVTNSKITNNSATGPGAGLSSATSVTVTNSTMSGNSGNTVVGGSGPQTYTDSTITNNPTAGNEVFGGGHPITITRSTIANNGGQGTATSGDVNVTNSTISDNAGFGIQGSGIVTIRYSTIVHNQGNNVHASTFDAFGTVIALPNGGANCNNPGSSFGGSATNLGFVFTDDSSCGFPPAGVDPKLGPLANNGGPTPTRAPQSGSPLIDTIPFNDCRSLDFPIDQRGAPRPSVSNGPCSIGSVESGGVSSATIAAPCGQVLYQSSAGTIGGLNVQPIPLLPTPPAGVVFPCGLIGFTVSGLRAGETVTVTITLPNAVLAGQYYKLQNGVWTQLLRPGAFDSTNGGDVIFFGNRGTLQFTDGGANDADGIANGVIVDPGAPGFRPIVAAPTFTG